MRISRIQKHSSTLGGQERQRMQRETRLTQDDARFTASLIPSLMGVILTLAASIGSASNAMAEQLGDEKKLPRIEVVGEGESSIARQPGSVAIITRETLDILQPLSTQDALKSVPGIVVREEEGYGFIPNIGLRGLNPNRSQKLLVLEDGVPVAPGLFTSNESYYSPRIERMEGIEVLKGAAGLRYGPSTIGGVINYQTKKPEDGVTVTSKVGSHGYNLLGLDAGGKARSGDAVGGISLVTSEGDGFRNNGFRLNDVVVKGGIALSDNQWLSAKFTHYDNDINTSYVGLRKNEYITNPTKNPAPNDVFLTRRNSFDINHEIQLDASTRINTLVYWSQLDRDFWRREIAARTANGTSYISCDGSAYCLFGRNRSFEMVGIDSRLHLNHVGFGINNETEIGVRLHHETMRNQSVKSKTDPNARSGDLTGDEQLKANSVALYGQNRFILTDKFAITPGVRVESYSQSRQNELVATAAGKTSNTEFVPGIGATYQLYPEIQMFAGAYRGFAPAMVATAISSTGVDQQLNAERSVNIEFGARGSKNNLRYEATLFHMDFSNQIVNQSASAGITQANAGKTLNQGIEGLLAIDLGTGWSAETNMTWLPVAKYNSNRTGGTDQVMGNRLPYAPEWIGNFAVNYRQEKLNTRLYATYIGSQYTDALNTEQQNDIGTLGKMPAYVVFNWSTRYAVSKQLSLIGAVRNIVDKKFIASRNPDGIFPGAQRNFEVGLIYKF